MKTKFKLLSAITALLCAVAVIGCSNIIEDLKEKGEPEPGPAPQPAVYYNIDWNTTKISALDKTPFRLATETGKIVFGYSKDYASVIADSSSVAGEATYTKYAIGETAEDLIYAYYKADSGGAILDSELYVLSEGEIRIEEDDMYNDGTYSLGPFYCCMSAESIVLENFNTSSLTSMNGFFALCASLKSLDISGLDTSNVTDMSGAFGYCVKLESVNISGIDTSKVEKIDNMFDNCPELKSLDFSTWNMENVNSMKYLFSGCSNLETIYVKEGTDLSAMSSITSSEGMFENCDSLAGGKGTLYNSSKTDKAYARIDAEGTPGYFTKKGDTPFNPLTEICFEFDSGTYVGFDSETMNLCDYWYPIPDDEVEFWKMYVPAEEDFAELSAIPYEDCEGLGYLKTFEPGDAGLSAVDAIVKKSTTKTYVLSYIDYTCINSVTEYRITKDIKTAMASKENPELPASLDGHNIIYIYYPGYDCVIYDMGTNKKYQVKNYTTADNVVTLKNETGEDFVTKPKSDFPDKSTAQKIASGTIYQINDYGDDGGYVVGKAEYDVPGEKFITCGLIHKYADGKYYIYGINGGI